MKKKLKKNSSLEFRYIRSYFVDMVCDNLRKQINASRPNINNKLDK